MPANIEIIFSEEQRRKPVKDTQLGEILTRMTEQREFHYGIEISAHFRTAAVLNYEQFGSQLPLFTSITWAPTMYGLVEPIVKVPAIVLAKQLQKYTPVVLHFTCYRASRQRVSDLLALDLNNILALRGDLIHGKQDFKYASELVAEIRRVRGDTISIGVAAYPEGHPAAPSIEEDMISLVHKVQRGANFIITQVSFSAEKTVKFVRTCRELNITVPILIGTVVPEDLQSLTTLLQTTKASMSPEDFSRFSDLSGNPVKFQQFSVKMAVDYITEIFRSDIGIYGVQFYTLNQFNNIRSVISQLSAHRDSRRLFREDMQTGSVIMSSRSPK